jgi:hypothetical protein
MTRPAKTTTPDAYVDMLRKAIRTHKVDERLTRADGHTERADAIRATIDRLTADLAAYDMHQADLARHASNGGYMD